MWKTVSSKEIFKHPRLTIIEDEVILPSGAKTDYLKFKDDGGCCATIIAKRKDGKILLQTDYSYPPNQRMFQFPGGAVPSTEKTEDGANRELMEEAGMMARKLELLGSYLINNRRSAKKMLIYLATELEEKSLPLDQEESPESFWFSENEIAEKIKNNEIINCHVLSAWCLYISKK